MHNRPLFAIIIEIALTIAAISIPISMIQLQLAHAAVKTGSNTCLSECVSATGRHNIPNHIPIATIGNNVYLTWSDNSTGNWETFFAKSTDSGKTFDKPINLSNDKGRSDNASIVAAGKNVYVTWWSTNNINNNNGTREPVFRASSDNGKTFGPLIKLDISSNATVSTIR